MDESVTRPEFGGENTGKITARFARRRNINRNGMGKIRAAFLDGGHDRRELLGMPQIIVRQIAINSARAIAIPAFCGSDLLPEFWDRFNQRILGSPNDRTTASESSGQQSPTTISSKSSNDCQRTVWIAYRRTAL